MEKKPAGGKIRTICVILIAFSIILSACIALAAPRTAPTRAAAVNQMQAKAWDCGACHKEAVLPADHVSTKEMPYEGCLVCHLSGADNARSLRGRLPASHIHAFKNVNCVQCHGKVKKYEAVDMPKCVACHGSTAGLAKKTAGVQPQNPHTSPHYGTNLECNLCHHQHARSEDYCAYCHKFNFVVP